MKRLKYILPLAILITASISCKKNFLDVPDPSTVIRQSYVTDLATTSDFLEGIYVMLAQNFYEGFNQIYPETIADNIKPSGPSVADFGGSHYNWVQIADQSTGTSTNMNGLWMNGYQIIRSCNFVLQKADEYRNQNPATADDIKAQAYSLRALVHFTLSNVFAQSFAFTSDASHPGIPYVTNYDWTTKVAKRNTVAEVYANIIQDLKTALPLFKAGSPNKLFINSLATKALLARVYLFKGDFNLAKNLSAEVSTAVPLMAAGSNGYPSKLFTKSETESLFQLLPSEAGVTLPGTKGTFTGSYYTTFQGGYFYYGYFFASEDIANILTQNASDLRSNWVVPSSGMWQINKYPQDVIAGFSNPGNSYYQTLLRSSEMYLTAAEAYAQLGSEDSARYYLNAIRTRAKIPAVTNTVAGVILKDSIYLERRRELSFEGLRMFDLLRWKKSVNRSDAWSTSVQTLPYPSPKAVAPVPLNDVNISGLSQNQGY